MQRSKVWRIGVTVLGAAFSLTPLAALAQAPDDGGIMQGTVVAAKTVKAYAHALGASTNEWGDIYCQGGGGEDVKIAQSTIYRVKTARSYYDLSKVCGMGPGFLDTWSRYERLKAGDRVRLRAETTTVHLLSYQRCRRLGLLSKSLEDAAEDVLSDKSFEAQREAARRCSYKVPIMHVRTKGFTITNNREWDFRIVGSGPAALAKTAPIGKGYRASLLPPW